MSDINDAAIGLAQALGTITGLNAKHYADDGVNAPEAHVFTRSYDPRMVFGSTPRVVELGARIIVSRQPAQEAQERLREYMSQTGNYSVIEAVENDANWPAGVHYVEVTEVGEPFELNLAEAVYLAVDFSITCTL